MIEVELFPDVEGIIKRRAIRKLLNSEIIEKSIEVEKQYGVNT